MFGSLIIKPWQLGARSAAFAIHEARRFAGRVERMLGFETGLGPPSHFTSRAAAVETPAPQETARPGGTDGGGETEGAEQTDGAAETPARESSSAGSPRRSSAPRTRPAASSPRRSSASSPRRPVAPRSRPAADQPVSEVIAGRPAEPIGTEAVHVSESPELVEEVAEPGAEDGAGAQVRIAEPWKGYRAMKAADVIDRLASASPAELAAIELYELAGRNRKSVVAAAQRALKQASPPR
jgi:hypothetical protein